MQTEATETSVSETSSEKYLPLINEEHKTEEDKPLLQPVPTDLVPTTSSTAATERSSDCGTRNTMTVTTTHITLSSPELALSEQQPQEQQQRVDVDLEPVHYVDERSKALDRKAELEALRNRKEIAKKKGACVKCTSTILAGSSERKMKMNWNR